MKDYKGPLTLTGPLSLSLMKESLVYFLKFLTDFIRGVSVKYFMFKFTIKNFHLTLYAL